MRITIEIDSKSELERLSALFKTFNINTVKIISSEDAGTSIARGNKQIDPEGLFGLWKDAPRSIHDIRKAGWERN